MSRIEVEQDGPVWIVSFNNPPGQYMDDVTTQELGAFLTEIESSDEVRVVVLTGAEPGVFVRHYDVGELVGLGKNLAASGAEFSLDRPIPESGVHSCYRRMEEMAVPFIAAVNGTAMGGGFEMALASDIRLVQAGDFDLGLPEVNVGLFPGAGGTQRLSRLVGQGRAMEMTLLGRTISPQDALHYGLALECVEGDVLARALEIARELAQKSPLALGYVKQLVRGSSDWTREQGLERERTWFCDVMISDQGIAEMDAMVSGNGDIRDPG